MPKDKDPLWSAYTKEVKRIKRHTRAGEETPSEKLDTDEVEGWDAMDTPTEPSGVSWELMPRDEAQVAPSVPEAIRTTNDPLNIVSNTAKCLAGWRSGLNDKVRRKLSKGQVEWESRFDLHGYYEADAWQALMGYLHDCVAQDLRCVLIICGKGRGYGDKGDMGIIKSQMAGWLAAHPGVLGFYSAQPKDGGSGALYALLRRRK